MYCGKEVRIFLRGEAKIAYIALKQRNDKVYRAYAKVNLEWSEAK